MTRGNKNHHVLVHGYEPRAAGASAFRKHFASHAMWPHVVWFHLGGPPTPHRVRPPIASHRTTRRQQASVPHNMEGEPRGEVASLNPGHTAPRQLLLGWWRSAARVAEGCRLVMEGCCAVVEWWRGAQQYWRCVAQAASSLSPCRGLGSCHQVPGTGSNGDPQGGDRGC